jgi:two-component system sensor histidine kinase UhpB
VTLALGQEDVSAIVPAGGWHFIDVTKLVFSLIATQAIFWSIVLGVVYFSPLSSSNLERFKIYSLKIVAAKSADDPSPVGSFEPTTPKQVLLPNPGILRFDVNVKDPEEGIGIFIPRLADNAVLIVNGARLSPPKGAWGDKPDRTGVVGLFYEVPTNLLVEGANQFQLIVVRSCCSSFVNAVFAGPLPLMRPISDAARWFRIDLAWIIIATSALLGLIAASMLTLDRNRAFIWSVVACSLTVIVGTSFYLDTGSFISASWRIWYGHILGALLGYLSFLSLVNAWTGGPRWIYRAALIVGAFCAIVTAALVPFQSHDHVLLTSRVFVIMVLIGAVVGVWLLLLAYVQTREMTRYWQASILLITSAAAIVDFIYALQYRVQPIYFVPFSNLILTAAIGFALTQRGARLYQEAEAANLTLAQRIEAKETELIAAAAALRIQAAETTIQAERARIMRDMHDGMGGQLLSLLVQTRDPDTSRAELEETVEAAIGDLRLLIDSLDSVGDSLDVALAVFRDRLEPRLRSTGIEIKWHNNLAIPTSGHPPSMILNVYRILQEAMANCVRHAEAGEIIFSIAQSQSSDKIEIVVHDNGKGISADAIMGRGLANMRRRATEIGGELVMNSSPDGTRVCLVIPQ